jgi:HPt (histidine-containing phosphotransfer) domain-containing protein
MDTVINRDVALARIEGDEELLNELFQLFLEELPGLVRGIRGALAQHDGKALQQAAHSLKGAAANLAADTVAGLAKQMESMGRDGNLDDASATYAALEAEVDRLKEALVTLS